MWTKQAAALSWRTAFSPRVSETGFSAPEYLEPGKVEKLVIRTSKISHCFLPGHRLRVSVTSGAKHFVFPNSNTKDAYNSTESRVAHNTVWHGGAAPSHILLHVER
ncbi:CocE/NonD family hydrolase C-terminal non-catalytic domain-containing protein [Ruthenibacterium lactatiformans]|uniref:CocE/NonD family hydrolase C-terminal non-catalytic domain-containing protein n=1 Tax=Ruthenibacterium lactatiformans TaxID=1550024 RepID=UPI00241EFDB7|nr:CocE/NonD family hydrolase C-terminal non-catalytic domain-containing protein [Ruthenibacterium lactatiformans]